jgi:hypothetical protein
MSVTQIQDAMPGESLIGIEPQLLQQVDPGWRHRLALFNGRTLTAAALDSEQSYRAGRLAVLGQTVTQGTVKGLELSANLAAADPVLNVTAGYGISATGEDVALLRTLRTTLSKLLVIDPQQGSTIAAFPDYAKNPANTNFAGVLVLQPITGQVSGASVDTGTGPIIVSGNLNASCDQDPEEYAFEDWQIVDGVRLVLVAWPTSPASLKLPTQAPAVSYRNRLAYTIFNAELALTPDDRLPWDMLGVPLAVMGFDATWKPQFVDRYSVVRSGGLARGRYVLPVQAGTPLLVQPALAQARVNQLSEQIGTMSALSSLASAFPLLPPCGVLPASAMDFVHHEALWLPSTWTIQVGPVHQEEVETALLTGMKAQPLDVTKGESVEILVPLPDALYDPDVLIVEDVAPAFQQAVDSATAELAGDLQHRKAIQQEANALSFVLTGVLTGTTPTQPLYNLDAGLTDAEKTLRDAQVYKPTAAETFGTGQDPTQSIVAYTSTDYGTLINAANGPYTLTKDGNGNPLTTPLPLFSGTDLKDLADNGLQHFINLINAKLSSANDLLDLAFLTAQSDIYRFRQYVLGATGATALAVSPIAAEIATGESAASTAANLQSYLGSILPATTTTPPPNTLQTVGARLNASPIQLRSFAATLRPTTLLTTPVVKSPTLLKQSASLTATLGAVKATGTLTKSTVAATSDVNAALRASAVNATTFVPQTPGTVAEPASTSDVLQESPLVGAQLNLRTLSIAQRLANPPSQEGLFYSVGNRLALLQLLADLEIVIDDIPILVDYPPPPTAVGTTATTTTPPPNPLYTIADIRATADPVRRAAVLGLVQTPQINAPNAQDPDEASLFSTGIHVLEQHSSLLRAVEARIQQYNDFLTLCSTALSNVQTDLPQAQTLLTQLENDLAQARQDVAFTTALLNDETQRVANVNAQRTYTLQNYVLFVAYTRQRTVVTAADVPSRQLVPGNVANPVPSCLQQSVSIPPELREIVALLREAPINWLPSVEALLQKLERPSLLQSVAVDAQARATLQLQLPLRASSASGEPGVYAPVIANIYSTNQQAFRKLQTQRAAFQPQQLVSLSWASQVETLKYVMAPADLIASNAVHAEVTNATARLMQQVSSVATCLYARANQALPIDRLAWAEFLRGQGLTVELQSLAVLPNWNTQDYVSRRQMQMLVDWLFLQIDASMTDAVAFMSDVVRVSILLASDAPANTVIAGAVTLTSTPKLGGVISLNLPSDRIVHGMYVQLYSAGVLTAQAVVSDLDSSQVSATVTQIYKPGVPLQVNDVAHFVTQAPAAAALRAFDD